MFDCNVRPGQLRRTTYGLMPEEGVLVYVVIGIVPDSCSWYVHVAWSANESSIVTWLESTISRDELISDGDENE